MSDIDERIKKELEGLRKALKDSNDGRARACARRAANLALSRLDHANRPISSVDRLREAAKNNDLPENIRKAALRLTTNVNNRLSPDFSMHPENDATIIIHFVNKILAH